MKEDYLLSYAMNLELESTIDCMELVIMEAKLKSLENKTEKDFTEQEKRIEILRKFQNMWLEVREDNRVLNETIFKVTKNFHLMSDKIEKLEKENDNLKNNTTI